MSEATVPFQAFFSLSLSSCKVTIVVKRVQTCSSQTFLFPIIPFLFVFSAWLRSTPTAGHTKGTLFTSGCQPPFFFLNIRESSYKNKTLFLDSACRITPQIHSLRDTNSSDQRKSFLSFFPCFRFFLLNIYLKKEEFYFLTTHLWIIL